MTCSVADLIPHLKKENAALNTRVSSLAEYSDVVMRVKDLLKDWKNDCDVVDTTVKREVKEAVKENLKEIMTEAVDKIVNTDKMKKTFAEVVKNSENVIGRETKKCFENSLSTALKESQNEIISQTAARQEADLFDKERRTRNVVISPVPESKLANIPARVAADKISLEPTGYTWKLEADIAAGRCTTIVHTTY